jgi:putative FmdB family regulatory protein
MTYEYVCEACGHQWEAEQSIKDAALKTCVSCGESKAKRLVSGGTGFLLKGGGWYADLYSSSGAAKSDAAKADDKGAKAGATGTKAEGSESKPAPAAADSKSSAESKPSTSAATPAAAPSASATSAKAS